MANKQRTNIGEVILSALAAAGLVTMAIVAPNAIQALRILEKGKRRKTDDHYRVQSALTRLINYGYVEKRENKGKVYFKLTQKGEGRLHNLYHYHLAVQKPRRWDGKWRIVSFDVHEKRRRFRDRLRFILKSVGFKQIHQSLWVYPYDCEELLALLKSNLKMGRNVLYITALKIEYDQALKQHFKLK